MKQKKRDEAKYEKKWRNIVSSLDDCIQFNGKEFTQMLLWKAEAVTMVGVEKCMYKKVGMS